MKLEQIRDILEAEIHVEPENPNFDILNGCGSDLMSDVLSLVKPNTILLTGLATPQVIYTAEMASIQVICFVRGKHPTQRMIDMARERGIILLSTNLFLFDSCGKLYSAGLGQPTRLISAL
ncbi:MAG TPA: hypothetical protein PK014_01455 [Thermoanaerobaculia bacterium]|nr:hypothetical protein [Thermoanaerobaculia bacterium]HUM28640.1 hypothetical protein [Thermoanaerobaculia bacterium]HXK66752.1 hypothetical protein [Thermoanaerobaculia bacterium]